MMQKTFAMLATLALPAALVSQDQVGNNWPSYRGLGAKGVADGYATAVEWDVVMGENILWQTDIPGLSHSSPVIWGDNIFVITAVKDSEAELKVGLYGSIGSVEDDSEHEFKLLCIDRESGQINWVQTCWRGVPEIKRHPKGSHAISTPAADATHVAAFFGSEGLYVYGHDGELLWQKSFGTLDAGFYLVPDAQWGFGSSPVISEGRLLVQCDIQGESFIAALDVNTGEEIWRTMRDEVPTWGTPTVNLGADRRQVIVNGYKHIGGYDFDTGAELWKVAGGGDIPVPTPVVAHGMVFITNAHGRMAPILAISADAKGEFSMKARDSDYMIWSKERSGNYMQTPLVYGDLLYCCKDNGVVACYDARSGKRKYQQRLGSGTSGFSASGVAADGKLYFTSEEGEVYVIKAGAEFDLLAVNEMGETCMATPAISAGVMFFRTRSQLVAVAVEK